MGDGKEGSGGAGVEAPRQDEGKGEQGGGPEEGTTVGVTGRAPQALRSPGGGGQAAELPEPLLGQRVPIPLATVEEKQGKRMGPSERPESRALGSRDLIADNQTVGPTISTNNGRHPPPNTPAEKFISTVQCFPLIRKQGVGATEKVTLWQMKPGHDVIEMMS